VTGIVIAARSKSPGNERLKPSWRTLSFKQPSIAEFVAPARVDVFIGRLTLLYVTDPAAVIHGALTLALQGGMITFQEYDRTALPTPIPPQPLYRYLPDLQVQLCSGGDLPT
jgi:hypothetical protein